MKKVLSFGLLAVVLVLTVFTVACNKKKDVSIIGKWEYFYNETSRNDIYYEFNKDNTGKYSFYGSDKEFKYEDSGKELTIKYEGDTNSSKFEYSIKDDVLTIKDSFGDNVTYKKK